MIARSYTTLNSLLIFGLASEVVRIQDEWHDYTLHVPGAPPPEDLRDRFKAANDLLLQELLRHLWLDRGQMPPFKSRMFYCQGIRIYVMFEEFRWTYKLAVFSDGVRQITDEDTRGLRYFICKDAHILCVDFGEGSPSGRCLMQLRDGRFLDCFWDATSTLKQPLDPPYEKFRVLRNSRVLRWLQRHDRRDEVQFHYPDIYSKLESGELTESHA